MYVFNNHNLFYLTLINWIYVCNLPWTSAMSSYQYSQSRETLVCNGIFFNLLYPRIRLYFLSVKNHFTIMSQYKPYLHCHVSLHVNNNNLTVRLLVLWSDWINEIGIISLASSNDFQFGIHCRVELIPSI